MELVATTQKRNSLAQFGAVLLLVFLCGSDFG